MIEGRSSLGLGDWNGGIELNWTWWFRGGTSKEDRTRA